MLRQKQEHVVQKVSQDDNLFEQIVVNKKQEWYF